MMIRVLHNVNFNFLRPQSKVILSILIFYFTSQTAMAMDQRIEKFISSVESEVKVYGDEVLNELQAYRLEVEKNAYVNTLKLCEGYRRAKGLGPHPSHGQYMFSADEAASAWGKVLKEGAAQPFSAVFGLKADFLEKGHYGYFDFKSWFQSMHTMFFINSSGFLAGAMHCLNTMDQREIGKLATAIVIVDYEASLVSHAVNTGVVGGATLAVFWSATKIFRVIGHSTRFLWSPTGRILKTFNARIPKVPYLSKIPKRASYVAAKVTLGVLVADQLIIYMNWMDQQKALVKDILDPKSELNQDEDQGVRFLKLYHGVEVFRPIYKQYKSYPAEVCESCEDPYTPFYDYLDQNISSIEFAEMQADQLSLSNQNNLSNEENSYLKMLNAFVPILAERF